METILVADDHEIVRQGIKLIISSFPEKYRLIEASTCSGVLQWLSKEKVDYLIADMQLEDGNIFFTGSPFTEYCSITKVLVYTMNPEKIYGRRLIQKGVKGFLSKRAPIDQLETAIRSILNGEMYLSTWMKEVLASPSAANQSANPIDLLSDRELEVVEYVSAGLGLKEIAQVMHLDTTTAGTYRRRAFSKLGVDNTLALKDKFTFYKLEG
ncbi:MAG TPA: response regulator transcription factor [Chitinophagaceae bacterium]|nr:response regulator transcription factor [Chitinophagaceae bacterium]